MEIRDDLISRAYVLAEYDRQHKGPPGRARKIMEEAPAVAAAPVVHSTWHSTPDGHVYCASCGFPLAKTRVTIEGVDKYIYLTTKDCQNCGAKMDGGEQDGYSDVRTVSICRPSTR